MSTRSANHGWALSGLLLGLGAIATLFSWWELFVEPDRTGFGDYQFFHHSWEAALVSFDKYGQWPLWNPYQCGGIPDWADPQAQFFHPLFLLSFVFGTTLALKAFLVLHALSGLVGQYLLARDIGLGLPGAAFAAASWTFSGYFAWHCGTGHGNFIAFYLAPLTLLCWRRARADLRYAAGVAVAMTLVALGGGAYAFPFFVLLLAFDACISLASPKAGRNERLDTLTVGTLVVGLIALTAAIRLLPIVEHLAYYPRRVSGDDTLSLQEVLITLTRGDVTEIDTPFGSHPWVWTEYGAYIGWIPVVLGCAGTLIALGQRRYRLLLPMLAFLALTLGNTGALSPWALLQRLPVFEGLRIPTRMSVLFLLYFTLLGGLAVDAIARRMRPVAPLRSAGMTQVAARVLVLFVLFWTAADLTTHHRRVIDGMWRDPPSRAEFVAERFVVVAVPRADQPWLVHPTPPRFPHANLGTAFCYTGMAYRPAPGLWAGELPQVRARGEGARVEEWSQTPLTFNAVASLPSGGRVIVNRTYAPGWRSDVGTLTLDRGRIAVDLPAGRHRIALRYAPVLWPVALLGSLLGALLCVALIARGRRLSLRKHRLPLLIVASAVTAALAIGYAFAPKYAFNAQFPDALQPETAPTP